MRFLAIAAMLLALASSVRAQGRTDGAAEPANVPVSAERVSERLTGEPLKIPPLPSAQPTFHVDINSDWPRETPLDAVRKELAAGGRGPAAPAPPQAPGTALAPGGVDVLPAIGALVNKIKTQRREHAEAGARRMVDEDLAAFCAVHDCSQAEPPGAEGVIVPGR